VAIAAAGFAAIFSAYRDTLLLSAKTCAGVFFKLRGAVQQDGATHAGAVEARVIAARRATMRRVLHSARKSSRARRSS